MQNMDLADATFRNMQPLIAQEKNDSIYTPREQEMAHNKLEEGKVLLIDD